MRLWLVRHGLTEWNTLQRFCGHSDIPLSAQGRVQARWLARRLQEETISTIHTSDLARARETADPEHYSPPRGESLAHMLQRVRAGLEVVACSDDVSPEGDVVIVSHGGPLRALLCNVLEIPLERQWLLRLDHGSLSAIDLLPVHEPPVPRAILALLNAQRPTRKKR